MMTKNNTPAKYPKRKVLYSLLLTGLMIVAFVILLMGQNAEVIRFSHPKDEALEKEVIRSAVEEIGHAWKDAEARLEELYVVNRDLAAFAAHGGRDETDNRAADMTVLLEKNVDFHGIILRPEAVCGGHALLVREDSDSERGYHIVFKNDLISDEADLDRAGLTRETIRQNAGAEKQTLTLGKTTYEYSVSRIPEMDGYLLMLVPKENLLIKSLSQSTFTIALTILLLFGLAVSSASLYSYIRHNALTPNVEQRYQPISIRRFTTLFGVIGVIMIAISGWLDQSLNSLYDFSVRSRDVLAAVDKNIEINAEQDSRGVKFLERIYLAYGDTIADILNEQPEMCSGDALRFFCDRIGASSITLYDSQGIEFACSGDYIDLELGRDPQSATWEFRRILKGAPSIFREAETDGDTGLNEVRLGMRIRDPAENGKYGVMIIALDPSLLEHDAGEEINRLLDDMTVSGARLWISDLETGQILMSSDRRLIGKSVKDLGLDEMELRDALMRELNTTDEGPSYIASSVLQNRAAEKTGSEKGQIAFYAESRNSSNYQFSSIVLACIAFLVMYIIVQKFSLREYTDEFWSEYKHHGIQPERNLAKNISEGIGQGKTFGLKTLRKSLADFWRTLPPGEKGLYAVEIITSLFLLQQIPITSIGKDYARDTVYYYITTGNWTKGTNLFALAAIVNLMAEVLLCVIIIQVILKGLSLFAGIKGKTIFRLLSSSVRYIALFNCLVLGASYLGVDRATILTSIGAVSLAVSLGAQDLIGDVIAGVAIVFEGNFHVGEVVQISDSTGKVLEIGIRCTKILEQDGDIVVISNRAIAQVVNMTQHSSWYTCELVISTDIDIEEFENMLQEELPKIGEGDLRILSGPLYRGITALEGDTMTLWISTECRRDDYEYVRQKVNRDLQRLMRRRGIDF